MPERHLYSDRSTPQEPRQAAIKRMAEAIHRATCKDESCSDLVGSRLDANDALDALLSDPQSVIDLLVAEKVLEPWGYEGTEGHESGEDAALYRVTPESEAKE